MNPEFLVHSVVRGVLGGRRKRSNNALRYLTGKKGGWLTHPQTLLTAAGLAWGVYETLKNQGASGAGSSSGAGSASGDDPGHPGNPGHPGHPTSDDALRMVRLAISAAHADGTLGEKEHAALVQEAKKAGAGEVVQRELLTPQPLAQIVAGVTDRGEAATLYVLAYTILRADEQVSGAERIYLAQLANLLGLTPQDTARLEKDVGERIDALGDQGQLGG